MLNKIINNLKDYPEDECYEINGNIDKKIKIYINIFATYIIMY